MPRPPAETRDEIRLNTREKLLAAAAEEFAQKGYVGANINEISTAAGFAKGTIYNYFPSKHDLMLALIGEIGAQHSNYIIRQVKREETAAQRLKRFFSAGYEFVEKFPHQAHVAINVIYGYDMEFKDCFFQAYTALIDLIHKDIVSLGIAKGEFRSSDDNMITALLMSLYLGSISLNDYDGNVWFDADSVMDFAMGGLKNTQTQEMD
ncbi:MAG: TetR/AcrR family transcriptional regulator [Anaerolineales bacterium]|jgi:AcrR family transcriptional regulator